MKHSYPLDIIRGQKVAWRTPGVCPVAVSDKLKSIRELREPALAEQLNADPRLAHVLLYLQWQSHQPGGLDRFAQEFILEFPELVGTAEMLKIPRPRSGSYALDEAVRIWRSLPDEVRRGFDERHDFGLSVETLKEKQRERREAAVMRSAERDDLAAIADEAFSRNQRGSPSSAACKRTSSDPLDDPEVACLLQGDYSELRKVDSHKHAGAARLLKLLTPDLFWSRCAQHGMAALPQKLSALCISLREGFTLSARCFQDVIPALLEMMDRHAAKARTAIASTTITEIVNDKLQFAVSERANVLLAGDSRLGKTVTMKTAGRQRPGQMRVVTMPSGSGERELLEAHAAAFLWPFDSQTTVGQLRDAVKHILKHSGLFIAYDEFHFAIPNKPRRGANPPRLDFIRCNVVDRNLGAVFCTTRQSYTQVMSAFVKQTRYAIEQWVGRLHDTKVFGIDAEDLNAESPLTRENVMGIARKMFPKVDDDVLELAACKAYRTSTPPHGLESILKTAQWIATKGGRNTPSTADANAAIAEWEAQPDHEEFERSRVPRIPPKPEGTAATQATALPGSIRSPGPPPKKVRCMARAGSLNDDGGTPDLPSDHSTTRAADPLALDTD